MLFLQARHYLLRDFHYDNTTGIATVTTLESTGFSIGNNFIISGADSEFYNGEYDVSKINSTQFF